MYIDELELRNFRLFEHRKFAFHRQFNLLIGKNGRGKSSVLRALRIAAGCYYGEFAQTEPDIRPEVIQLSTDARRDSKLGLVHSPKNPVEVSAKYIVDKQYPHEGFFWSRTIENKSNTSKGLFVIRDLARMDEEKETTIVADYPVILYFGTGRIWNYANKRRVNKTPKPRFYNGYIDCCDENVEIKTVLPWFKQIYGRAFIHGQVEELQAVLNVLQLIFPEWQRIEFNEEFDQPAGWMVNGETEQLIPYDLLSDGQQVLVNMTLEICYRSLILSPQAIEEREIVLPHFKGTKKVIAARGVVMIDELDMHLHVGWQREIIGRFIAAFPNIQFFATTHSPVLIQSCKPEWLVYLDDDHAGGVDEDPRRLSTSSIQLEFQDTKPRSVEFEKNYLLATDYIKLLKQSEGLENEALDAISEQLNRLEDLIGDASTLASLHLKRATLAPRTLKDETSQ